MVRFATMVGGLVAMLIFGLGVAFLAVDIWSNIGFRAGRDLTIPDLLDPALWDSTTAAIVVVAIGTSVSCSSAMWSFSKRAFAVGLGLLLVFVCGAAFSLYATTSRVAAQTDSAAHTNLSHNLAIDEAKAEIERWQGRLVDASAGMLAECDRKDPATLDAAKWPLCISHWKAATTAKSSLEDARIRRASLGAAVVVDSGAVRFATITSLSPERVALYHPFFLPVALFAGGNFFPALAVLIFSHLGPVFVRQNQYDGRVRPMKDITPVDPFFAAVLENGSVTNGELAELVGVSDATASRKVEDLVAQGRLLKTRNGREVAIRVAD